MYNETEGLVNIAVMHEKDTALKEKTLLSIGLKILGLYLLIIGISAIPQIFWALESEGQSNIRNVQVFAMSWHIGINILFGLILTFKGDLVAYLLRAPEVDINPIINLSVVHILQLAGIFLIVSSVGSFIKHIIPLFKIGGIMVFDLGAFLSPSITILLGLMLCFRPGVFNELFSASKNDA